MQVTTEVGSVTYTWSINVAAVSVILVGSVTICERWKLDVAAVRSENRDELGSSRSTLKSPSNIQFFISVGGTHSSADCRADK